MSDRHASLVTPVGGIVLQERGGLLTSLTIYPPEGPAPPPASDDRSSVLLAAQTQLAEYFAGCRTEFDLPLGIPPWQAFSLRVLALLRAVPYGSTLTYGELAAQAGRPRAARAVGQVMAANPLPLVIPCHRVLAASGAPGGYSGGGGQSTKKWLLDFERAHAGR